MNCDKDFTSESFQTAAAVGKIATRLSCAIFMLFVIGCSASLPVKAPKLPDPTLTPGDVLTTAPEIICVRGYTKKVRNVPKNVKEEVYRIYGIQSYEPGDYEVDHLISLELGGSNSIRNLWPESYLTEPYNAHRKDALENKLHALVCSGDLSLVDAQIAIAKNWIAAYEKYVNHGPSSKEENTQIPSSPFSKKSRTHSSESKQTIDCPADSPVKVSKSGIYHLVGDPSYNRTKAIQCFKDAQAASEAGYRAPRN